MRYNDNARLDSGQVAGGGGGAGGRIAVGGGVGTMILLFILSQLFGIDLTGLAGGGQAESRPDSNAYAHCQTGQDIPQNPECRWVAYTNSIQDYWSQAYSGYQMTQTRLFTNQVSTACGTATSAVGPFYCPADSRVYLDETFFDSMLRQLGGQKSDAAEAYVIAHEYGHHIQNLTGVMEQVQRQGQTTGPDSPATRLELQADCYAGVWFKHVVNDPQGPISQVTQEDLNNALDAARIVGDDSIQQRTQGRVNPDAWTHGSSEQRKRWLATGYNTGDPNACNTFASRQV